MTTIHQQTLLSLFQDPGKAQLSHHICAAQESVCIDRQRRPAARGAPAANHDALPRPGPEVRQHSSSTEVSHLSSSSLQNFLPFVAFFAWVPLLSLSVCDSASQQFELEKMAPPEAASPHVLGSLSPNKQVGSHHHASKVKKRFEMQMIPASVASKESPRLGANLSPVATQTAVSTTSVDTPKALTPRTANALRIPGFDPARYGKPKTLIASRPDENFKEHRISEASGSSYIHSPATFSTLDDSGPITPHLSPTIPTSEDTPSVPVVRVDPSPPASLSSAPVEPPIIPFEPENQQQVSSSLLVQLDEAEELVAQDHRSTPRAVVGASPSSTAPPSPEASVQPHTQGRPTPEKTGFRNPSMNHSGNTANRYGRPLPSSNGPHGQETVQQKLQRLKVNELNSIHRRNRRKDRDQTASPATLAALRLPLDPTKEQKIATRVHHYHELGSTPPQAQSESAHSTTNIEKTPSRSLGQRSMRGCANPYNHLNDTEPVQSIVTTSAQQAQTSPRQTHKIAIESSDYYVPAHAKKAAPKRNSRWATNEEIKPDEASEDSNAWGSVDPDEISANSDDSVKAIHHGNVRHKRAHPSADTGLVGWDGKMQPPPIDWDDRPRFDNRSPEFKETFNCWTDSVADRLVAGSPDMSFEAIEYAKLRDVSYHPDGIGMVSRKTTITVGNAGHYGYSNEATEALRDTQALTREELNQVITIDTSDPSNDPVLQETTETVVQRWLAHNDINFDSLLRNAEAVEPVPQAKKERKHEPNPHSPSISIYVRPAVSTDIPQITGIYNWHVENGPRTAECDPSPESDMRDRFTGVTQAKLPFIVAVMKVKRRSRREFSANDELRRKKKQINGVVQNTNLDYDGMTQEEKIVGWACAQDFTCADYVERISAEVEVYVAHEVQRQGVGKCLMDKLMDACDRGHLKRGGYDFDCAPEKSYLYNGGGGRDLHKLYFILRTWSYPRQPVDKQDTGKVAVRSNPPVVNPDEDDYSQWLKAWLEGWNFGVEGYLKQAGAKNGRL